MAALELRRLSKSFGDHQVVDAIDLQVTDGEFLVLVGASGCGKSTILRLIAGLEKADAGDVRIGGHSVLDRDPGDRDVAMVFQNYALYPHMTVRRNIAFPLRMARMPREQVRARSEEAAAMLGIGELLERKPSQLSGGQQQRVALARALVRRPQVFLFDEPLSNVDARLRAEMRAELARLHQRLGATMIYVTHDQVEAMTLGDRIAVLHQGRVQQVGTPLEVYNCPANSFVAAFLGSPPMNLLPAAATPWADPLGANAVIGFRPQQARLGGSLQGRVELVEELGSESLVHVRCGDHAVVLSLTPGHGLGPGEPVGVAVEAPHLHHFDRDSGVRLP